ncbi:MAG: hypothetical protein HY692_09685 [Cyanobacteria bacterium NC_groundwater_1444_Ag_S-0.65um_54_12]|nr:hypothetical protein [Cyanobacteria bacterium NC_groundwater_1444_Ag_S-0.65um_54_12]
MGSFQLASRASVLVALIGIGGCQLSWWNDPPPPPGILGTPGPQPSPTAAPEQLRSEILSQLTSGPYATLFNARLINDGIGIFAITDTLPTKGVRRWGRDYQTPSNEDVLEVTASVSLKIGMPKLAKIVFERPLSGSWLGDFPWRKQLVKKPMQETLQRTALLEQDDSGHWAIRQISVAVQRSTVTSVDIYSVTLRSARSTNSIEYHKELQATDQLLAALPGEAIAVTVIANTASSSVYLYLGGNRRQILPYLGSDQRGARFSGQLIFPGGPPGPDQIGIDLVASSTLENPGSAYDATIWGVPVLRQGGEL